MIFSISRNGRHMSISKLPCIRRLTHWNLLFPIKLEPILIHFKNEYIANLFLFGLCLGIPEGVLETIEDNYPRDANRRMIEVLKTWMNSLGFPCWWQLVKALKDVQRTSLAEEIADAHGKF